VERSVSAIRAELLHEENRHLELQVELDTARYFFRNLPEGLKEAPEAERKTHEENEAPSAGAEGPAAKGQHRDVEGDHAYGGLGG
jgi:hypothetical protein